MKKKVVISIVDGEVEVFNYPKNVIIEVRDYDTVKPLSHGDVFVDRNGEAFEETRIEF